MSKYQKVTVQWENGETHEYIGEVMQYPTSIAVRPPRCKKFRMVGRIQDVISIEEIN
jgi:hypothetical protein